MIAARQSSAESCVFALLRSLDDIGAVPLYVQASHFGALRHHGHDA